MTDSAASTAGERDPIFTGELRGAARLQRIPQEGPIPDDLARRLIQRVAEPIEVDGVRHVVSAEVGLAMSGDSLRETPALVRAADLALYAAKARRDGRPVTFARHMDPAASPVREAAAGF